MDFIRGLFDGFDFGSILMGLLLVTGLYFLARTETGKELLGGIFGEDTVKDFFAKSDTLIGGLLEKIGISGFGAEAANTLVDGMNAAAAQKAMVEHAGLTAQQAQILAPDEAGWKTTRDLVKKHGSFTNPLSDKVIHAFLLEKPDTVRQLIDTIPQTGATTGSNAKMMAAVRAIAADPERLGALIANKDSYAVLMHATQRFSPVPLDAAKLDAFIKSAGLDTQGKPTKALCDLLTGLMDGGNPTTALTRFITTEGVKPEALAALAQSIPLAQVKDESQRTVIELLQHNAAQTQALIKALGPDRTDALVAVLQTKDQKAIADFVLKNPELTAFAKTADIDKLPVAIRGVVAQLKVLKREQVGAAARVNERVPVAELTAAITGPDGKPSVEQMVGVMLNSDGRTALRAAGTADLAVFTREASPALTQKNLDALLSFGDAIGAANASATDAAAGARAKSIVSALASFVVDKNGEPFAGMKAEDVSAFFASKANADAFGKLLKDIDTSVLPNAQRIRVLALREHWGNVNAGIAEVLGSREGATLLIEKLNDPEVKKTAATCTMSAPKTGIGAVISDIGDWTSAYMASDGLFSGSGKIGENADAIKAVMEKFRVANCSGDVAPNPAPVLSAQAGPQIINFRQ